MNIDYMAIIPVSLVSLKGDCFEFYVDGRMVYDFPVFEVGQSLRWIEHIASKEWVTTAHIEQFARLAAQRFGVRYT